MRNKISSILRILGIFLIVLIAAILIVVIVGTLLTSSLKSSLESDLEEETDKETLRKGYLQLWLIMDDSLFWSYKVQDLIKKPSLKTLEDREKTDQKERLRRLKILKRRGLLID